LKQFNDAVRPVADFVLELAHCSRPLTVIKAGLRFDAAQPGQDGIKGGLNRVQFGTRVVAKVEVGLELLLHGLNHIYERLILRHRRIPCLHGILLFDSVNAITQPVAMLGDRFAELDQFPRVRHLGSERLRALIDYQEAVIALQKATDQIIDSNDIAIARGK
jgi:hypothetical protein